MWNILLADNSCNFYVRILLSYTIGLGVMIHVVIIYRKDEFFIECPSVGMLKRIRVSHDNKGGYAGWFLDKVEVEDLGDNHVYEFPCQRWLAVDEDDGALSRDLAVDVGPVGG